MDIFKKFLFCVFYVTLFIGGLFFSKDTVTQFLSAKTSFRTIMSNIETKDLPVIILCYERALDPKIQVRQNVSVTQIILTLLATRSGTLYSKECQKILPMKDFLLDFKKNVGTSFLDFEFIFSNNVSLPNGGLKVILASEDNSYGIGTEFFCKVSCELQCTEG